MDAVWNPVARIVRSSRGASRRGATGCQQPPPHQPQPSLGWAAAAAAEKAQVEEMPRVLLADWGVLTSADASSVAVRALTSTTINPPPPTPPTPAEEAARKNVARVWGPPTLRRATRGGSAAAAGRGDGEEEEEVPVARPRDCSGPTFGTGAQRR